MVLICKQKIYHYVGLNTTFLPLALALCDCLPLCDDAGLRREKTGAAAWGDAREKGPLVKEQQQLLGMFFLMPMCR